MPASLSKWTISTAQRGSRSIRFTDLPSAEPSIQSASSSQMNHTGAFRGAPSAATVARLAISGRPSTACGSNSRGITSLASSGMLRPRKPLSGAVQRDGSLDQRPESILVHFIALTKVDGAPDLAVKARIEQARWIVQRSALGEGQFHHTLVGFAGADDPTIGPHRNAPPLPFLDDFGGRLMDERADMGKHPAPPAAQFLDPRIDQPGRRFAHGRLISYRSPLQAGCLSQQP